MFKKKIVYIIYFYLVLILSNSCTLIGFGVGTVIDDNKSDTHYTINEDLFDISPETEIILITNTNDTLVGLYKKTTNEYSADYITEYNSKYDEIKEQFIKLNSKIKIEINDGQYLNQDFINNGFEFKLIPIMSKIHIENKSGSNSIFYHNIKSIQTESANTARYLVLIGGAIDIFLWLNLEHPWGPGGGKMWEWD